MTNSTENIRLHPCLYCGSDIANWVTRKKYCNNQCKGRFYEKAPLHSTCKECNKTFRTSSRYREVCGEGCRLKNIQKYYQKRRRNCPDPNNYKR